MIKLLGIVPTKRAEFDEQGEQVSPAEYSDDSYYAMSSRQIVGLDIAIKPSLASGFSGVETYYYAFADEADAKQQLGYDEETESFNVTFYPTVEQFKKSRQEQLDSAVVTTQSGKSFDADETSINRMDFAVQRAKRKGRTTVQWSTADVGTGVKVEVTVDELEEALDLAVENMDAIWGI